MRPSPTTDRIFFWLNISFVVNHGGAFWSIIAIAIDLLTSEDRYFFSESQWCLCHEHARCCIRAERATQSATRLRSSLLISSVFSILLSYTDLGRRGYFGVIRRSCYLILSVHICNTKLALISLVTNSHMKLLHMLWCHLATKFSSSIVTEIMDGSKPITMPWIASVIMSLLCGNYIKADTYRFFVRIRIRIVKTNQSTVICFMNICINLITMNQHNI